MNRRTLLSSIIMTCALAVMTLLTGGNNAAAQQDPNCCHYTVNISAVPNSCFPINLATKWNCNGVGTLVKSYTGPGSYIESIGMPPFPPCPPACTLAGVSLDNMSFIGPGETERVVIGNCCYTVSYGFGPGGCIVITISGC